MWAPGEGPEGNPYPSSTADQALAADLGLFPCRTVSQEGCGQVGKGPGRGCSELSPHLCRSLCAPEAHCSPLLVYQHPALVSRVSGQKVLDRDQLL